MWNTLKPAFAIMFQASLCACDPMAHAEPSEDPVESEAGTVQLELPGVCEDGDWGVCVEHAHQIAAPGGSDRDPARAHQIFLVSCEASYSDGCVGLGHSWGNGWPGTQDLAAARTAYAKACHLGNQEGCIAYADALERGLGGPVDRDAAVETLSHSCEKMLVPEACLRLGLMLRSDSSGTEGHEGGRNYLEKACASGMVAACQLLQPETRDPDKCEEVLKHAYDIITLGLPVEEATAVLNTSASAVQRCEEIGVTRVESECVLQATTRQELAACGFGGGE